MKSLKFKQTRKLKYEYAVAPPPPPGAQILSISCSFWENLAKSYVDPSPPPPGGVGSAADMDRSIVPIDKEPKVGIKIVTQWRVQEGIRKL